MVNDVVQIGLFVLGFVVILGCLVVILARGGKPLKVEAKGLGISINLNINGKETTCAVVEEHNSPNA